MKPRVVHVIQGFSRGGAARSLLATAGAHDDVDATVVSLAPADPWMRAQAAAAGLPLVEAPTGARLRLALEAADVVQVHFWNSPELYGLLRGGLPAMRLAVWLHVAGDTAPQVVTAQLLEIADVAVAGSPHTARLPVFGEPPLVIADVIDPARLSGVRPSARSTFDVGYVGTVDFGKMHPRFVELSSRVDVPDVRFVVCGAGDALATIAEQARRLGVEELFELRGYVEDVGRVLAALDVFGYPLAPGNYSASDLALQEAMAAGVPPVVLPYGGAHALVRHGETGLVADEESYPAAVESLYADATERARLGHNARESARSWGPVQAARAWSAVYAELLEQPKRDRCWPGSPAAERFPGAAAFVESLGGTAPEFAESLAACDEEAAAEAEARIAAAPPVLTSAGGGGILHYRRAFPRDAYLRLWAGLVLEAAGRNVLAVAELKAARELGCDRRVLRYLDRAAEAIGMGAATRDVLPRDAHRPAVA
jgi:hypothetical protein